METKYWKLEYGLDGDGALARHAEINAQNARMIRDAGALLNAGQLVAFPTETVYGLGANAFDSDAVAAIFKAKGRPSDNPLIVHIADYEMLDVLTFTPPALAQTLMEHFWPGPLTLVLPVRAAVPSVVTAGLDTVAVRMPDHAIARALIRAANLPLAAPSANRSGKPSPTRASHVAEDLNGKIAGILDGGPCTIGIESTVVRVLDQTVHILRPGMISVSQMARVLAPDVTIVDESTRVLQTITAPRSPGQKYRHYAPQGDLQVFVAKDLAISRARIEKAIEEDQVHGRRTAALMLTDGAENATYRVELGSPDHLEIYAFHLYDALRACDRLSIDCIYAQGVTHSDRSSGIMNRLIKAAGGRVEELDSDD